MKRYRADPSYRSFTCLFSFAHFNDFLLLHSLSYETSFVHLNLFNRLVKMRSSSVVLALAATAAVTPAFAAPVSSTYSSQQTTGSDESGAVKLGNIADVASIGSSVVSVLHNLFGGYV